MEVQIRKATAADVPVLQNFMKELMRFEHDNFDKYHRVSWAKSEEAKEYYEKSIGDKAGFVIVAEYNGKIIGYLHGAIYKGPSYKTYNKQAELNDMFVSERFRSKKVGTLLINAFFKWAIKNKAKKAKVQAFAKNGRGLKFYSSHGFKDYLVTLEKDLPREDQ